MISFNVPPYTGKELYYIRNAAELHCISGSGNILIVPSSLAGHRYGSIHGYEFFQQKVIILSDCILDLK